MGLTRGDLSKFGYDSLRWHSSLSPDPSIALSGHISQANRGYLGSDGEPVAAADVRVDLEAHVVRHVILPHVYQRIQSILHQATSSQVCTSQAGLDAAR